MGYVGDIIVAVFSPLGHEALNPIIQRAIEGNAHWLKKSFLEEVRHNM